MKSLRDQFQENYMPVTKPANNKRGVKVVYVYYAPWYVWNVDEARLKKLKWTIGALCALDTVLFFLTCIIYTGVNYEIFVGAPAMLSICGLLFQILGAAQFAASPRRTTRMSGKSIRNRLVWAPRVRVICLLVAVLGGVYTLIRYGADTVSILVVCAYLVCVAISGSILFVFQKIPVTSEKNTTADHIDGSDE